MKIDKELLKRFKEACKIECQVPKIRTTHVDVRKLRKAASKWKQK
jgi:hypothetical protein